MRIRSLPLALALSTLAACGDDPEAEPARLTRLELAGATALVSVDGVLYGVSETGAAHAAVAEGSVFEATTSMMPPPACLVRAKPLNLTPLTHDLGAYFGAGEVLRGGPDCPYAKASALIDRRTGDVRWLPSADAAIVSPYVQEDGRGRPFVLDGHLGPVHRLSLSGRDWVEAEALSEEGESVVWFGVSTAGDVAYGRGDSTVVLRSDAGARTTLEGGADFSRAWRGPDGALRILRTVEGTTTLHRIDFGETSALTPLASWEARQGELTATVAFAGGTPVRVEPDRVRVFPDPDAEPVETVLGFDFNAYDGVSAGFGALWFVASPLDETRATRAVRWTPDGTTLDLLPAGYEVRAVVPYAASAALVRAKRLADAAELWLRVSPGAEPTVVTELPPGEVGAQVALD